MRSHYILIFVVLTWFSVLLGLLVWSGIVGVLRMMAKADPMMRHFYLRHIRYRPTSTPWRKY